MSRLDRIDDWLNHEPCCDHAGADEHGCWDCLNTGHTHGSTITFEDAQALVKFAKAVRDATSSGKDILAHGAEIDTDFPDLVSRLGASLHELENPS